MTVFVALLRGVNVGGRGKLAMADLRRVAEGLGYERVRTYIQSGNVVLDAPGRTTAKQVADDLRAAIAGATDVQPDVIVRTRDELAAAIHANPFADRDLASVHVVFGSSAATSAGIDADRYAPEEVATVGRETYLFLPGGVGRSKLGADLARRSGPTGTMRNWRTVTKLLAMADEPS